MGYKTPQGAVCAVVLNRTEVVVARTCNQRHVREYPGL